MQPNYEVIVGATIGVYPIVGYIVVTEESVRVLVPGVVATFASGTPEAESLCMIASATQANQPPAAQQDLFKEPTA